MGLAAPDVLSSMLGEDWVAFDNLLCHTENGDDMRLESGQFSCIRRVQQCRR